MISTPMKPVTPPLASPPTGLNRKKWVPILAIAGMAAGVVVIGIIWLVGDLPKIYQVTDYRPPIVSQVIASHNGEEAVVGEFFRERRVMVPFESVPKVVVDAFVAAEDDRFFEHQGISFAAILRAFLANLKAGQVVQGGSTITQQVAKSLFLTPARSIVRKLKEAVLAYRLESHLTKDQILYVYLNQIYLGRGAYGVSVAARSYFRKELSKLTLAEAALIAGLPTAPSKFNPFSNPHRAKQRQAYVLRRMFETGKITEPEMKAAIAAPLRVYRSLESNMEYGPYFIEHIRRHLVTKYGEKAVQEDGLKVYVRTTPRVLMTSKQQLQAGLRELDKRRGYRGALKKLVTDQERFDHSASLQRDLITRHRDYFDLGVEQLKEAVESDTNGAPDAEVPEPNQQFETLALLSGVPDWDKKPNPDILSSGEILEAWVSEVRDGEKLAFVRAGLQEVPMKFDDMLWAARPGPDGKLGPPPKKVSDVLAVGDLIRIQLERRPTERGLVAKLEQEPEVQGAILSMEVNSGFVLAMEGGFDFRASHFNRAIQALRQPGSAFKPIIFASAVEKGFTPASIIVDAPIVYKDEEFGNWKPSNIDEKFSGDTTFRKALIDSRNIPTIKLVQQLQVNTVIEYARRLGLTGQVNQDLSISLGSGSFSLVELVQAYAVFARQGRRVQPIFFTKIVGRDGTVLEDIQPVPLHPKVAAFPPPEPGAAAPETIDPAALPKYPPAEDPDQVVDPRVAYVISHLLREVVTEGTGRRASGLARVAAGKTGTTNDYRDAWFIGFTPDVITGVWTGFDDQKSLGPGETGSRAALPIWLGFMNVSAILYPERDFPVPDGIVFVPIDTKGRSVGRKSAGAVEEAFIMGTEPRERVEKGVDPVESGSEFLKEDFK